MLRFIALLVPFFVVFSVHAKTKAKILRVSPVGEVESSVSTIFIRFESDVVQDKSKEYDFSASIQVKDNSCKKTYWTEKHILACDLEKLVSYNQEATVTILKKLESKDLVIDLEDDYSVQFVTKTSERDRDDEERITNYTYDRRNRILSISCSGKNNQVSDYYAARNTQKNESDKVWINCEWGSSVSLNFSNPITLEDDKSPLEFKDEELNKKIAAEIKESTSSGQRRGLRNLNFILPENEGQYEFSFRKDAYQSSEDGHYGPTRFVVTLYPKPYSFKYNRPMAVLERKGPWQLPFEYRNIDQINFDYKVKDFSEDLSSLEGWATDSSYVIPLEFKRNVPERWYLDLKKLPGVNPDKANFFEGQFVLQHIDQEYRDAHEMFSNRYSYYDDSNNNNSNPTKARVLVTDLGLHFKVGYFNSQAFVFSLSDGKPVSNASVKIFNGDKQADSGKTNQEGFVILKGTKEIIPHDIRVLATKGDDFTYITASNVNEGYSEQWNRGITPSEFNLKFKRLSDNNNFIASSITDRPIYKPGDKVRLKVFTRRWSNTSLSFIADYDEIKVNVQSSRSQNILEQTVKINKFGTAVLEFTLPENASTGEYEISVRPNKNGMFTTAGDFKVEDFRTSPFKITTDASYASGDIKVEATGEYHFGGKLKNAQGELLVSYTPLTFKVKDEQLKKYFGHYWYSDDYYEMQENRKSQIVLREDVDFNSDGYLKKTVSLSDLETKGDGRFYVEVSSKDNKGAKVAGSKSIEVYKKNGYLGAGLDQWSYRENAKIEPKVVLIDPSQKVLSGHKGEIKLFKIEYFTNRRKGSGNYYYYDYSQTEKQIDSCEFEFKVNLDSCELKLEKSGSYFYTISTKGLANVDSIRRSVYVWGGSGYASQQHFNHSRIDLVTSQTEYRKGETAKILIKSPFSEAEALLTIERDGIIESKRIKLDGSFYEYELKLDKKEYLPGIFVSVLITKGRTSEKVEGELDLGKPSFYLGYTKIDVVSKESHLDIQAKPKSAVYEPGQMVEIEINTKTSEGKGVESELAVAIIDEAVLQLVGGYAEKYKIHDDFYHLQHLGILNYQTLINLVGRQTYGRKGGNAGGGGGVDESLTRKDFKAVAHWEGQLVTNSKGEASVKFKAPDNLTGWRAVIVAVDSEHRFGFGESSFKVAKPLMIIPALPNFLTEQDRFVAKFQVFNKTGQAQSVKMDVSSDTFHIPLLNDSKFIQDDSNEFFKFVTQTKGPGDYSITAKATDGKHSDAVETKLNVRPIVANSVKVSTGVLLGESRKEKILYPKGVREGTSQLSISYSNTLLNNLKDTFEYLLIYPYGCWEQRMSKVITWAQYHGVKDSMGPLNLRHEAKGEPLSIVREFIDLGPKYQDDDGGMMYYPSEHGSSDVYLSIYTGEIFSMIKRMGIEPPSEVVNRLIPYLRRLITTSSKWPEHYSSNIASTGKVRVLYILSQFGETNLDSAITKAISEKDNMTVEGRAYLLRVLNGREKYKAQFEELQKYFQSGLKAKNKGLVFDFEEPESKYWLYTPGRTQCQVYSALITTNSFRGKEDAHLMVKSILASRNDGYWYNTQESMYCLTSAFDYLASTNTDGSESPTVESLIDGQSVAKSQVSKRISEEDKIKVDPKLLKAGVEQTVEFKPSAKDPIYYRLEQRYLDLNTLDTEVDEGFSITKVIFKLDQKNLKWEELEGHLNVKVGDILKIVLVVRTDKNRFNVGINDPLAASFEPINYNLDSSSKLTKFLSSPAVSKKYKNYTYAYSGDYFRGNGFHHIDLRLHAAQFYADRLYAGEEYTAEYSVSVGVEGSFLMDATRIEEMYYPDIYGTSKSRRVEVSE